ncbi:TonB-dependent receptor [Bacteroidales bacterium]|nr:TonB-dependent receptor [Bacteroidales bacterium]
MNFKNMFNTNRKDTLVFKSWKRCNYAVFKSIHRTIKISVIGASYSLLGIALPSFSQSDTLNIFENVDIDEVSVLGARAGSSFKTIGRQMEVITRDEISKLPVSSVSELLSHTTGVDIRSRGANDVQSDISLRGGTFDQVMVLVNGINVSDAQTGHHNMNLPVDLESIERIEVLYGPGARTNGVNAFSGAINIVTKQYETDNATIGVELGEHAFQKYSAAINTKTLGIKSHIAFNKALSNGYIYNSDFDITNLLYTARYGKDDYSLEATYGYTDKKFGANTFYHYFFDDQYEETQSQFAGLKVTSGNLVKQTLNASFRYHNDHYEFLREDQDYYLPIEGSWINTKQQDTISWYSQHNNHYSRNFQLGYNASFQVSNFTSTVGLNYNNVKLYSNNLKEKVMIGDTFFLKNNHIRTDVGLYLEEKYTFNRLHITAGILINHNDAYDEKMQFLPGIDLAYWINDHIKIKTAYNITMRLPSYTDLYLKTSSNKGNQDLKPEKAQTIEGGFDFFSSSIRANVSAFYRMGNNIIDWVLDEKIYYAQNIDNFNIGGISAAVKYNPGIPVLNYISINGLVQESNGTTDKGFSKYTHDHLKYKAAGDISISPIENFDILFNAQLFERNGQYYKPLTDGGFEQTNYTQVLTMNVKIQYTAMELVKIYCNLTNLSNEKFYQMDSVELPGRWITAGAKVNLDFNRF